jgi:alpha-aminoadipic semialdehyde synthase
MAVDILPASIPLDASNHFSEALLPYMKSLIREYRGEQSSNDHKEALARATITTRGELKEQHRWLGKSVQAWRENTSPPSPFSSSPTAVTTTSKKKVLILGSGMVAAPTVDEISKRPDIELLVGSYSGLILRSILTYHCLRHVSK